MIAIVHSIYSQSVHAPARDARLMDNDGERYCKQSDPEKYKEMQELDRLKAKELCHLFTLFE